MKKALLVISTAFLLLSGMCSQVEAKEKLVWWYTGEGKAISLKNAVNMLKNYDVIMFGEYHDQTAIHNEQRAFLQEFYKKDKNIALSLEMIEKDNDEMLQKYLRGEVTEEFFLQNTRPWKNYREDYAPMVNFCKSNKLDVIAANIPRYLANQYAKQGTLDNIAEDKRQYLPRVHIADKDRYFAEFAKAMTDMSQSTGGRNMPPEMLWNFYKAQCIKDDMMAQSIFDYLQKNSEVKILHIQGSFHGRFHLGVADKLKRLLPNLKIAVVSPVYIDDNDNKQIIAIKHKADGDLLLLTKQIKNS